MDEITKEEAARDFSKRSGESREAFFLRVGENLGTRLERLGFRINPPLQARTGTVYLKAQDKTFEVRVTDHDEGRGTKEGRIGGKRYVLFVKGTNISTKDLNELLRRLAGN